MNAQKQTFTRKGCDYATMHMLLCTKAGSDQSPLQSKKHSRFLTAILKGVTLMTRWAQN